MNVDNKTKKVVLELLSYCNLNCKHCIYKNLKCFCFPKMISKEKAFKLIKKFSNKRIDKLVLTGGEPTLHPNFIEIAKYSLAKIPKVSICTNGVILDEKLREKICKLNFSNYTVSIDSYMPKIHDEFRRTPGSLKVTTNFLKKLKTKNKKVAIHITVHPENINTIEKTIKFCKRYGKEIAIGSIYHNPASLKGKALIKYNKKLNKLKEKYTNSLEIILIGFTSFCKNKNCNDLKNVFMINCDGQLVNCYWKKDGGKIIKKY